MDQTISERFIKFAGSKAGGSQRLLVPFDLEIGQDVPVTINHRNSIYGVVKAEFLDNQDSTVSVVHFLNRTAPGLKFP
jgi:hypothetical protein